MARKGWANLSANYRARLTRHGITQSGYESGESLQRARGHAAKPGQPRGSERFRRLIRLAEKNENLAWYKTESGKEYTAVETVRMAIADGLSMAAIDRAIRDRQENTQKYRQGQRTPGAYQWYAHGPGSAEWNARKRRPRRTVEALYWYH